MRAGTCTLTLRSLAQQPSLFLLSLGLMPMEYSPSLMTTMQDPLAESPVLLMGGGNNGLVWFKVDELGPARWHGQHGQLAPGPSFLAPQPTSCSTFLQPQVSPPAHRPAMSSPGMGTQSQDAWSGQSQLHSPSCPGLLSHLTPCPRSGHFPFCLVQTAGPPHNGSERKGHPSTPLQVDFIYLFGI